MLDAIAIGEGGGELVAGGGYFVSQASGQELIAEMGEFFTGWIAAHAVGLGPPDLVAEFCGVGEGWGLHEFEVLLVLRGGAGGDFVEPLADVAFVGTAEARERGEELIVAADTGSWDEAAHGEGVDEGVVEFLIFEGGGGGDVAFCADGLWRDAAGGADIFCEAEGCGVDAEMVGGGVGDEGLGVDGATEMAVEISALGHAREEGMEFERVGFCGVEGADGAAFRCLRR